MAYELNLNLPNLKISQSATYIWNNPNSAAAHEGVTLNDGTQLPGYAWADITHQRVNVADMMGTQVDNARSLQEAFNQAAAELAQEYKQTLADAPDDSPFDYQAIAQSQNLQIE